MIGLPRTTWVATIWIVADVAVNRRVAAIAGVPLLLATAAVAALTLYRNLVSLAIGLPGLVICAAALWWLLTEIGVRRAIGAVGSLIGLGMVVESMILVLQRPEHWLLRTSVILGLLVVTFLLARYSLMRPVHPTTLPPPTHPVLLCNPKSGGGKVEQFGLVDMAERMGVEVVQLAPGLDLEQLTRDAVARGADCLGMAGGDGSQALVASVAIEHDLPFICIPAGTRNHFALDLGLNRDDPRLAMDAFRDGVERRVDYATVNGRLFVNNVSLGVYATIVQSEDYRDAKAEVTRAKLTKLLGSQAEPFDLQYTTEDGQEVDGAFLVMVSNNPYVLGTKRDVSQRREMDSGRLGVFAVSTRTGAQAGRLIGLAALGLRSLSRYWHEFSAPTFEIRSHGGSVYLGVDGEALEAETPLVFRSHPLGLRMRVPRDNLSAAEHRRARSIRIGDVVSVARGREPRMGSAG
jgi:diacylglycerol kinase family enzyme